MDIFNNQEEEDYIEYKVKFYIADRMIFEKNASAVTVKSDHDIELETLAGKVCRIVFGSAYAVVIEEQ